MFDREKSTTVEKYERPSGIFTRLNGRNEDGQVSTKMTLVGGFGLIALTATLWITSTAAGSGADTANCISDMTVGCSDRNARVADASRQNLAGGYVNNFGSQNGGGGGVSRDEALTNGNNKVTKEDLPAALESIKRIMDLPMASRPYSQDWLFYDSNNVYSNDAATRDEMVAALRKQISNSEKNLANYRFPFASDQELNKIEELLNATGSNTVYSRTDSKGNVYKYSVSDLMRDHVSASKQNEAIRAAQDLVNRSGPMTAAQFKKEFGDLQKRYLVIGGEAGVWKTAYNNMDAFGKSI